MDFADDVERPLILDLTGRALSGGALAVGGRRHVQGPADGLDAEAAAVLAWPFAYDVVDKTAATDPMVGHTGKARKTIAEGALRAALRVPHRDAIAGKRILVIDDVFTEGFTIREVARALHLAGAAEVSEIVLAREPWKRR